MKQALQLRTNQSLKMSPKLQQAINLLQLSSIELELEIKNALESNPMLESLEPPEEATDLPINTLWSDYEPDLFCPPTYNSSDNNAIEQLAGTETSLRAYLSWQLNLTPFSDIDRLIAVNIIDSINDDGYLLTPLEELQLGLKQSYPEQAENLGMEEISAVLHRIQQFDPLGVASRNLQECMLIQLQVLPADTPYLALAKTLVTKYLELLAAKKYDQLKSLLSLSEEQLQATIHTLTNLHPHPGQLMSTQKDDYIIPDVIVSKENNQWVVGLNKDSSANIRINPCYASLIKRADTSRDNQFLGTQLNEAKFFLSALRKRNETLLKVASCIIQHQRDFLEYGEEKMQPLILQTIAQDTGLNESTISRITTKKYVHTLRGIYELKFFFSSHVANKGGDNCSSTAIKAIIKQLVSKETSGRKLTDQQITDVMLQRGIKVSRRTVAKYREILGIQPSTQR